MCFFNEKLISRADTPNLFGLDYVLNLTSPGKCLANNLATSTLCLGGNGIPGESLDSKPGCGL